MKKESKKRLNRILTLFVMLIVFFSSLPKYTSHATADVFPFDSTNVLTDLESSKDFNLAEYYIDKTLQFKSPGIINFVEWCYSAGEDQSDFALYVYFYNADGASINTESASNRIQMATAYDKGKAYENASPTDYNTFPLIFCNKSTRTGYEGLFYKFRIQLSTNAKRLILLNVDMAQRRYDISGITLVANGKIKEYPVGGTYRFKGYAKGYGADKTAESTLESLEFKSLETIELKVNATTYSNLVSVNAEKTSSVYNDVTSVYFSVPKKYIYNEFTGEKIANLQRVKCEWYEYKTKPIFVVNNKEAYNALYSVRGIYRQNVSNSSFCKYGIEVGAYSKYVMTDIYGNAIYTSVPTLSVNRPEKEENPFYWIFYKESGAGSNVLVSRNEIENYAKEYNLPNPYGDVEVLLPAGAYNVKKVLFEDSVDEGRTKGYNVREFDNTADRFNILDTTVTENKFLFWKSYGIESEIREGLAPIEMVESEVLSLNNSSLGYTYLVDETDVDDFRQWAIAELAGNKVPYIFHFAQTESTLMSGHIVESSSLKRVGNAQASTQTVFFNFKIITLTFDTGEGYKVIPVTQDPVNIYKDINKDEFGKYDDDTTFWDKFLTILILAVLIVVEIVLCAISAWISRFTSSIKPSWIGITLTIVIIIASLVLDFCIGKYAIGLIKDIGWLFQ